MNVHSYLDLRVVLALIEGRQGPLHRTSLLVTEHRERRIVRRWIGRRLVRIGARLAGEPTMRPAEAR
jgi:hypothetical protein